MIGRSNGGRVARKTRFVEAAGDFRFALEIESRFRP
jgi:hypothetical protein